MQKSNRGFRIALCAALSCAMAAGLTGCGRGASSGAGSEESDVANIDSKPAKGELTVWALGNEGELLPKLVKEFEEKNPDVHVKVTAIPWTSAHDKIQTSIAAGTGPDVAQVGNTWMADFGTAFSQVPGNFDLSGLAKSTVEGGRVSDKQLGVPWYIDTRVLYYRTDLAEKAGWDHAPQTWDEFRSMASDLQRQDGVKFGFYVGPSGMDCFISVLPFAFSSGANLTSADGSKWTINTPEMKKGLTFTSNLFKDKIADVNADVSPGANTASFASGKTAMLIDGPTAIGQIEQAGGEGIASKFTTAPLPKGDKGSVSFAGGSDMVVFKHSKNKDAAWKLVKWFSQPETQARWFEISTDMPTSIKAWDYPALKKDPKFKAFSTQIKSMKITPSVTTWQQVSSAGDKIMEQINRGTMSVDEGLSKLQSQAEAVGMGK